MTVKFTLIILLIFFYSCQGQDTAEHSAISQHSPESNVVTKVEAYYLQNKNDSDNSISSGTEGNGALTNGKLVPFSGPNFSYFDEGSYLNHRAYVNHRLFYTLSDAYRELEKIIPTGFFYIMECSYKEGGKLLGHQTHHNGLSVDFMTPLMKDGKAFTDYDTIGISHYFLEFDNRGRLDKDTTVTIDFNRLATHIYALHQSAARYNLKIKKVILKVEYKQHLFATEYGKMLKAQNIYFVQALKPFTNAFHDDHYHVDFEILK